MAEEPIPPLKVSSEVPEPILEQCMWYCASELLLYCTQPPETKSPINEYESLGVVPLDIGATT